MAGKHFYDRGGIITNLDLKLGHEELKRGLQLEEHTAILDDHLRKTDGTYGWQGSVAGNAKLTVPKASLDYLLSNKQRVERVRARMKEGTPPQPISYDETLDTIIFAEEDQEAFEDGYICINCYQWQAVPHAPKCNWLTAKSDDESGCGHQNY